MALQQAQQSPSFGNLLRECVVRTRGVAACMQVTICSLRAVAPAAPTFPDAAVESLTGALAGACTDTWRLKLLHTAAAAARFTCAQAARVLRCFNGADSAAAVRLLLQGAVDVAAVATLEAAALPEDLRSAWAALGVQAEVCSVNPCGHYRLDLSLQVRLASMPADILTAVKVASPPPTCACAHAVSACMHDPGCMPHSARCRLHLQWRPSTVPAGLYP